MAERVCKVRVSLVLGNNGGMLQSSINATSNLTDLNQLNNNSPYIPWNHIDDMAGIFACAITNHLEGVYNSAAPIPTTQNDIIKAIWNKMYGDNQDIKPYIGQHLISKKIQNAGYIFKFPDIQSAINNLVD